jgi:hypothetical protein
MKIDKEEIATKTRQLFTQWKVTMSAPPTVLHDVNLEDEMTKILQQEIDWELMSDLLTKSITHKWTEVQLKDPLPTGEFDKWKHNLKGAHHVHYSGTIWLFEMTEDAEWFTLKWA